MGRLNLTTICGMIYLMKNMVQWIEVCRVGGMNIAHIITGRLETEGVPSRLSYDAAGPIYAITVDGLGEVRILVHTFELERAKAILAQTYNDDELNWNKPSSGVAQ